MLQEGKGVPESEIGKYGKFLNNSGKLTIKGKGLTTNDWADIEAIIKEVKGIDAIDVGGTQQKFKRTDNSEMKVGLQLTVATTGDKAPELVQKVTNEIEAEEFIAGILESGGHVKGQAKPPERDPNKVKQGLKDYDSWRKANPAQSTGGFYLIGNSGQILSGLMRGNIGEAVMGVLYALSNVDLFAGPRNRRPDKAAIIKNTLEDFKNKRGHSRS